MPPFAHQVKCPFCPTGFGVESHLSKRYNPSRLGYFICDEPSCGRHFRVEDQAMWLVYYDDPTERRVLTVGHLENGVVRPGPPPKRVSKPEGDAD
ncbi:MAG: hypothetical protein GF403_02565 [Candidatus Coatesbacteria bacterium]|nr:hypothetical protein [Candidatus Coatesbacteria bacterium]